MDTVMKNHHGALIVTAYSTFALCLTGMTLRAKCDPPNMLPPSLLGPPASPEEVAKAFQLSVQTEKTEYRASEPVVLDIVVKNTSRTSLPSPVPTLHGRTGAENVFDVTLKDDRGKAVPFTRREKEKRRPTGIAGIIAPFPKIVPGGETQKYQIWLNRVYDMTRSGVYSVTVTRRFATFLPTPDGKAIAQVVYHTLAPVTASVKVVAPDPIFFRQAALIETPTQGPVPQQRFVYVTTTNDWIEAAHQGDSNAGQILQFQVDPDGTLLPHFQPSISTGKTPQTLTLDQTGRFVYVANKIDNVVSQYHVEGDGVLKSLSPPTVAAGKSPVEVSISPDNRFAYVSNVTDGTVSQYRRDKNGTLLPLSPPTITTGGSPSAIAEDPSGRFVYVDTPNLISQFKVNPDGTLAALSPSTIFVGSGPGSITVEPTGHFAYIPLLGEDRAAQLRIDTDGTLSPINSSTATTSKWPLYIGMSPSGRYAYVANAAQNTVSQFAVNSDGTLTPLNPASVSSCKFPAFVRVDPTGRFVYVVGKQHYISQYRINVDGTLVPLSPVSIFTNFMPSSLVIATLPVIYRWGPVSGGLQLSARTTKTVFRGDAPIVLAAVLRGANKKSLPAQGGATKRFQITVKDEQEKPVPLTQYGESLRGQAAGIPAEVQSRLRGGSVLSSQFYLNRIFDLTVPGVYSVTVEQGAGSNGKTAKVVSNVLPLKIVESALTLSNP